MEEQYIFSCKSKGLTVSVFQYKLIINKFVCFWDQQVFFDVVRYSVNSRFVKLTSFE